MTKAEPMTTRPGWNYETPDELYQLWPPHAMKTIKTWSASWTEKRNPPLTTADYLDDDFDDGWRPDGDFRRGATPDEALRCFPDTAEAKRARQALRQASRSWQS